MKTLYTLLITLFAFTYSNAQIVDIPDTQFKQGIINNGVDTNNDGEIQVSEAEACLSLSLSHFFIYSLEGIEYFTNLEYLRCDDNYLTSLNVTNNHNLTDLLCFANDLTSLDVSQNPNLTWLQCERNMLSNLDLSNNPNLVRLYCGDNLLTNINITQNNNLEWLHCSVNQLYNLDVSQNPNLIWLYCFDNQLTNLDISLNPNLTTLHCPENELLNLDVSNGNNNEIIEMIAFGNSNLLCIQVDDENATYPVCDLFELDGWCKDEWAVYSEECELGINDNNQSSFTIYPNPAQEILNIESQQQIETVKIFNLQGQVIKEDSSNRIDVSQLNSGLYFVQVTVDGQSITKKIIKE